MNRLASIRKATCLNSAQKIASLAKKYQPSNEKTLLIKRQSYFWLYFFVIYLGFIK
jgi:hypothetical protein